MPGFPRHFELAVKAAAVLWTVSLVVLHATVDPAAVWIVAGVFSALMNATYPIAAFTVGRHRPLEVAIALLLLVASLVGAWHAPLVVIGAIVAHGTWDAAKCVGAGVPFFRWYTLACLVADYVWAAALLWYWL